MQTSKILLLNNFILIFIFLFIWKTNDILFNELYSKFDQQITK